MRLVGSLPTADIADLSKAALFEPGKRTEVFARFSTVAGGAGSVDTPRDVRGFAVKFYTDEGNWDLVGNNIPVFFIQDAMKFPDLVHAVKMEGFGVHTFQLVNEAGKSHFVKFHWKPKLGIQSTIWDEALKLQAADNDYHRRDLFEAIDTGKFPEWELGIQVFDQAHSHCWTRPVLRPVTGWAGSMARLSRRRPGASMAASRKFAR